MVRQKIAVTACLGTAGHVLLVAAVALVHAGPGALPVVDAFGAVEGLSMYCDVVRDDLPRRRRDGHRHGVWHPDVLHLREVPRGGSVLESGRGACRGSPPALGVEEGWRAWAPEDIKEHILLQQSGVTLGLGHPWRDDIRRKK